MGLGSVVATVSEYRTVADNGGEARGLGVLFNSIPLSPGGRRVCHI